MTNRLATLIVADDLHIDLTSKFSVYGIYTGDIQIAADPTTTPKLVFLVTAEADINDQFKSLAFEVKFPGGIPMKWSIPVTPVPVAAGRTRHYVRWPFLVQLPILRQGHIEAKLIHEKGEIILTAPWIVVPPNLPATTPA